MDCEAHRLSRSKWLICLAVVNMCDKAEQFRGGLEFVKLLEDTTLEPNSGPAESEPLQQRAFTSEQLAVL